MGHPIFCGWDGSAVVLCTMPTLATIKLSRRWGTQSFGCGMGEQATASAVEGMG
jgi:hypothetical protein